MSPELSIVAAFLSRETWERHHTDVSTADMPEDIQPLYRCIDSWHKTQNEEGASLHPLDFSALFFSQNKNNREFYEGVFSTLESYTPNASVVKEQILSLKRNKLLGELSLAAYDCKEGKKSFEEVQKLLSALNQEEGESQEVASEFVTNDLRELLHTTYQSVGLKWRLNTINRAMGSLRKGTFGVVFGRTEIGKTTLCASEFTCMAEQLGPDDGPVLWFNNEQEGGAVMMYVYRAALGITTPQLLSNPDKWHAEYQSRIGDKLRVYDSANITKGKIESLCRKYKPSLIVVDQLDKLKGFSADRTDLMLGEIYLWAREMAKTYAPVVGISQAGATGHNKRWLEETDLNNSKTAKAAECDFILGIGKIADTGWEDFRFMHFSKNKSIGDELMEEAWRHGKWETKIDMAIARYVDLPQNQ